MNWKSDNTETRFIGSSDWRKNKKAVINFVNDDDKCFKYATAVALNNEEF